MADCPAEADIKQIFKRLLSIPTNKTCFDCGNNNPTWASVTYGVFLCIDCSAVHRSLGVHLTFIRSTQLDTQWTWLQLRAMQCSGNANARAFFNSQGCSTTDSQKKYNSRAATLYREKVLSMAQHAMRLHGTKPIFDAPEKGKKVHIGSAPSETITPKKEDDFFSEHTQDVAEDFSIANNQRLGANTAAPKPMTATAVATNGKLIEEDSLAGPNVELALSSSPTEAATKQEPKRAFIGAKKAPAARKGKGMGAQRVKKNFSEIESRAQQVDQEREELAKNIAVQEAKSKEEQEKQMANMRLAYQDMSVQRKKQEDKLMKNDPKKAEQFERLGMGFAGNKGISHSAISDMQTIQQEAPSSSNSSRRDFDSFGEKPRNNRRDFFDDEFEFVSSWGGSKKGSGDKYGSQNDDFGGGWGSKNRSGGWDFEEKPKPAETFSQKSYDNNDDSDGEDQEEEVFDEYGPTYSRKSHETSSNSGSGDSAQKKFGSAKAISSDQFFGGPEKDYETKQNLSRVEGQTSISSDDFFGSSSGGSRRTQSYNPNTPDLQDIKDGVKQGVTKIAGKMSSLANGVMSSLQDRYG